MNCLLRLALAAYALPALLAGAEVIDVTALGARPDDGGNDLEAFREAARLARQRPGSTLVIPAGSYLLRDAEAVRALTFGVIQTYNYTRV